ncbi:MAG: Ribosomal silencing factor RsfS [Candidatus Erwinia impunctatus]|nr:Ribosomal silencing factor RsfS [Culicoides impunctatus]
MQGQTLQEFIVDKLDDLKGQQIITIDVRGKSSITDCMVICSGTSSRHIASLADNLIQQSRLVGLKPSGSDSEMAGDWVIVDFGDVIVHVMQEESRLLYELEKLWS